MPPTRVLPERPILVVDDDRKIVALVRAYLEREGYRVQTAFDGREALARFHEVAPALIVLDVMLPELDGLEVCRAVRLESDVPILMLSARSAVADRIRGLERGADDYLPKPFSPAELVVRVKTILRRAQRLGTTGRRATRCANPARRRSSSTATCASTSSATRSTAASDIVPLTAVEFRLLAALLMADGRVLTRNQLLDAVYGAGDGDVLDRTVDVHIGRLRDKLGDDADHPRYVATVRGAGYRAAPLPQIAP